MHDVRVPGRTGLAVPMYRIRVLIHEVMKAIVVPLLCLRGRDEQRTAVIHTHFHRSLIYGHAISRR